jgi:hypothetical protein
MDEEGFQLVSLVEFEECICYRLYDTCVLLIVTRICVRTMKWMQ